MKPCLTLLTLLAIPLCLCATQSGEKDRRLDNAFADLKNERYEAALGKLQRIDTSAAFRDPGFKFRYLLIAGACLHSLDKREAGSAVYNQIPDAWITSPPQNSGPDLAELFLLAGNFYNTALNQQKALQFFEYGQGLAKQAQGPGSAEWARFSLEIAKVHSTLHNDDEKALHLAENALAAWIKANGALNDVAIKFYESLSLFESRRCEYWRAMEYIQKALDITQQLYPEGNLIIETRCWEKIASIQHEMEQYDEAIENFLKILKTVKDDDYKSLSFLYLKIGNSYYLKGDYRQSLHYHKKALKIREKTHGQTHGAVVIIRANIAACLIHINEFEAAEQTILLNNNFLNYNPDLPNPFEGLHIFRTNLIPIFYFQAKNYFFWYKANGREALLRKACAGFDRTVRLVEAIHAEYEESGSKQYLLDRYYYVFEMALNAHYELYQCSGDESVFARALGYTERSRAILLTETLRRSEAGYSAGLPDSLRAALKALRQEIIRLENRKYLLQKQGSPDAPELLDLNQELFALKERRQKIESEAQKLYPAYARAGEPEAPPSPAQIQARLKPGEAWLTYFSGEDDMYAFLIKREGVRFAHIPKDFPLEQWVETLRTAIYDYPQQHSDSLLQLYRERAWGLYEKLMAPFAWELPERIVLAADGVLKYIPFEALLSAPPGDCSLAECPYLLKRYTISYAPSATLWLAERKPSPEKVLNKVLAFAPQFSGSEYAFAERTDRRSHLGALEHNAGEARRIRRFFRADVVRGAAATRDRFAEAAPAYRVLHLATHAKADDEKGDFSFLAFTKPPGDTAGQYRLFARELYAMPLQAELVVLSACETGIGEFRRGEGLMSLAYGFAQAGARSLVTSLWRVSDRETAELMQGFYAGLRRGLPKDEALRQAKLKYMAAQHDMRAHPFFWAAFVPEGDMSPLDLPGPAPAWVWAGALLLASGLGWAAWRRRHAA